MSRLDDARSVLGEAAVALVVVVAVLAAASTAAAQVQIPPIPEGRHYILDKADLISADAADEIGDMQKRAAEQHDTQIVVVTIESMAAYGGSGISIEEFAKKWFNDWGIGIRRDGRLYNRGILFLISRGDRKARIELGAEWGHRWDAYCRRVMNDIIVPQFKAGDYTLGIVRGADALTSMAERGPNAEPPQPSAVEEWFREARRWSTTMTPLPGPIQIALVLIGIALIALSFYIEDEKTSTWVFWAGVAAIVAGIATYVLFGILSLFGDSESTGYSGGGGFGGGFSGGGGATGSW